MSIFEWFCERKNLEAVGSVEIKERVLPSRSNGAITFRFLVAFALVSLFYYSLYSSASLITLKIFIVPSLLLLLYCFLGYFIKPKPDTSNMGWAGGLINNPFKITDNWNRNLMTLKIILMPGAFIVESFIQFIQLVLSSKNTYK